MIILMIEDDRTIREYLGQELENWGYEVVLEENFANPLKLFNETSPDLVLLDVVLPGRNGFFWCQEIRKISEVPIIFISSKNQPMDMVTGMQLGGDDYITKPFDLYVTRAKIDAILRRTYGMTMSGGSISYGGADFDSGSGILTYGERTIELTRTEMMILSELFTARGGIVSRRSIIERCWQGEDFIDDNTLAVNMTRLRKKLRDIGLGDFIITKKGVGYGLKKE